MSQYTISLIGSVELKSFIQIFGVEEDDAKNQKSGWKAAESK